MTSLAESPNTTSVKLETALTIAVALEIKSKKPHYVGWSLNGWVITTDRPLMGTWYTADGQKGGAR